MNSISTKALLAAVLAVPLGLAACGGGSSKSTSTTLSTTPATSTPAATTAPSSPSTQATSASTVTGSPSGVTTLPVGAATAFPFGSTNDSGTQISLLPPNADEVNQAVVAAAPKLGPFDISPSAGPTGWPDACKLTSGAQLHALFPAITGLSGTPQGSKEQIIGDNGNSTTPNNADCKFDLTTTFDSPDNSIPSDVEVQWEEIDTGSPQTYQQDQTSQAGQAKQYPAQYANYPKLLNGVQCFDDGDTLHCLKGDVYYWVSGEKQTAGQNNSADNAVWIDQIQIPVAEVLGGEITGS